nr:zinc finger, CCHC-type [Tanacetum cinerariifolium]
FNKKISEHIDEFNKIVLDLANIEVKFKDEDLALLLLTSLPVSYEHFVDTLLYGQEALALKDVMAILNSKKIKERSKAKGGDGEGLYVRGRTDRRDSHQSKGKPRLKSQGGRLKCYICQYEDHLKRNCPKNNRKKSTEALLDWIMESGCSYHMTPRLDIFFDFLECDRGSVLLGENKECKIKGLGKVRVQLRDGSSFVLHNVKYIPELKRNLISLGILKKEGYTVKLQSVACELNASVEEKDSLAQVWHNRLGHIIEAGLQMLEKQGLFGKKESRFMRSVLGKILGGKRYLLSIVDDYSRRICVGSGIAKHLTVVETPQDNGLAERIDRTLIDKRVVKYVLLGYPEGVKWYRLFRLDDESPKIVTSRNMVFNESVMYKDTLKDFGAGADNSTEELQVEVELQGINYHTLEEDQKDGDDEDVGDQETDQTSDLIDYQLVQDREPRTRTKPLRRDRFSKEEQDLLVSCKWLFKIKEGIEDDILIAYKSKAEIGSTKSFLKKEFNMKELGEEKRFLILKNFRIDDGKLVQMPLGGHFKLSLKDCSVRDCDVERISKALYANMVGSLMYLMVCTRLDIAYAVWCMRQIMATMGTYKVLLIQTTLKIWIKVEAEYMAIIEANKEAIWLRGLLEELGVELNTVAVNCDNQGLIYLSQTHVFHDKTKHINVRYQFIKEALKAKTVKVLKVGTKHSEVDALMKVVVVVDSYRGGTGVRIGRGGTGRRPKEGNDERVDDLNGQGNDQGIGANGGVDRVNGNVGNQGNIGNQNGNVVNENVQENVGNMIVNGNRVGCSYKEFLACNPKEYDGKGCVVILTRLIKKIENMHDMSSCSIDQKVKYNAGSFVGKALTWWNSHSARYVGKLLAGHAAYNDKFHENGLIKKVEKRGNMREPRKDKSGRDDNKRTRTGIVFATIINHGVPRNVNPVNARNPPVRACYECGHRNQENQARGRAFMLGAEEAHQDLNITTGIQPSELGFRYEIEIASGQLVGIDKVIKGCKLEIKGRVFNIDLIPFGHGSFNVIIGMDWLSNHKAKIIFHVKMVRIPLQDGKVLRVLVERLEEKARLLMSAKASDKKQEEIVVVRDFPEVFLDDLSVLSLVWEIEFRIELIPGATPVAKNKSPAGMKTCQQKQNTLAARMTIPNTPSELEELSGQL